LALIPVLVVMDGEQTALAAQEVYLPSPELVQNYLGHPDDAIPVNVAAHRLLFGEARRRIPRWHDLDRPVLHGALQGPESWALAAAARHPYFLQDLQGIFDTAFTQLAEQIGSRLSPLSTYALEDSQIVLVAQGAAVETAEAVSDHMREAHNLNIGVLGIRSLRPFPGTQIVEHLKGKTVVAVLERLYAPLSNDPPLLRDLRATFSPTDQAPHFRSILYGQGGLSLRSGDLTALCLDLEARPNEENHPATYLGLEFSRASSIYPKRQVLLDTLRRDYPQIDTLGLKSPDPSPDLRPTNAVTVAVHRISGQGGRSLGMDAAAFLQKLMGGRVRSNPGLFWARFESYCVDMFTNAPDNNGAPLRDPGDQVPVDLSVIATSRYHRMLKPLNDLRQGGALLCASTLDDDALWQSFPRSLRDGLQQHNVELYCLTPHEAHPDNTELAKEHLLGGIIGVLLDIGKLKQTQRTVISQRDTILKNLDASSRETHLTAFSAGLEELRKLDYTELTPPVETGSELNGDEVPLTVRRLGRVDDAYDSLPRFWDQVGVLYRYGESDELTPDPYLATGTMPPLSSSFRDLSDSRYILPVFNPKTCTGCGKCWSSCPDTAIGATAISASALLDTGIRLTGADGLRMVASKLASRMNTLAKKQGEELYTAAEYTSAAFSWLKEKMPMDAERQQTMEKAIQDLTGRIGPLPMALTEPFFSTPEAQAKDSGTLLSLAIDPNACKGCELCIEVCEPKALKAVAQTPDTEQQARVLWDIWEQLPDTPKVIIDQVSDHADVGPLPGLLLTRQAMQTLAGGDGAEAGSGERIAVRLALATAEYVRRPLMDGMTQEIDQTRKECAALIREILTKSLPTDDLDALAEGLGTAQSGQVQLASLTQRVEDAAQSGGLDAIRLRRLVGYTQQLGDLHQRLSTGVHGLGRAPYALAIAPGSLSTWAGVFPNNPFQVPVAMDMSGDTPQLAAGLLEGQLREFTSGLSLLRQIRLELSDPQAAARSAAEPEVLNWNGLTSDEKRLCPPILLLGNDDSLGGRGLSALIWLLGSDWPVKIIVLSDLDLGLAAGGILDTPTSGARNPKINLGLLALAQRQSYVAQTSISEPTHLTESFKEALDFAGPALIHIYAPSPEKHGFDTSQTLQQAARATASRVFPLFRYDPECEGVFGSRIGLEGNPDPDFPWPEETRLTPGDWARGQQRFSTHFSPLDDNATAPTPLAEYLELDAKSQKGKTPYVSVPNDDDEPTRYHVDAALLEITKERLHGWRTLQELAGRVTPFTAQIEQWANEKIATSHQAEIEAIKTQHEGHIEDIEAEIASRIQARLMSLAGYHSVSS
jgi:pyruvate-ferredoxin/flavodoxin oxidoreductase